MKSIDKYDVIFIDFDGTLVDTLSGDDFPRCISDIKIKWEVWNVLRDWASKKEGPAYIFIVSNQAGISEGLVNEDLWLTKVNYIATSLYEYIGFKCKVKYMYARSSNSNLYKPNTGMLKELTKNLSISKSKMLMIGDSSGKPDDFSDADKGVAINFGIDFLDVDSICHQ